MAPHYIHPMKTKFVFLLFISASMLLSGCGASFLTQSKAIVDGKKSYSKILVVSRGKNEIARSLLEQDIAKELKGHGVNAVAYHKESGIGVPVDVELSEQQVAALRQKVIDGGYDGAIITHLINTGLCRGRRSRQHLGRPARLAGGPRRSRHPLTPT